jgi:hypothetical protein
VAFLSRAAASSLLLVGACVPPQSAWERTSVLCGTEGWGDEIDPSLTAYVAANPINTTFPNLDCINAVIADWSIDAPAFEERDAWYMPEGRGTFLGAITPSDELSGLGNLLMAARFLFVFDLGFVGDVEESQLVRPGFVKQLRKAGGGRKWMVNEALYQILVDEVEHIRPATASEEAEFGEESGIGYNAAWNDGTITYYKNADEGGYVSLGILFHEVRHKTTPGHVWLGDQAVDWSGSGAFGWEAAMQGVVYHAMEPAFQQRYMGEKMAVETRYTLERIERYRTGPDTWEQTWDGFPWLGKEEESPWAD